MRYYGGKSLIGKEISDILVKYAPPDNKHVKNGYLEPFCGALGVMKHINSKGYKKCQAYDINKDLILLWKSIQNGTFKPKNIDVSRKCYEYYKNTNKHSWERGFVGLAYSYGGGWFNGYCPNIGERNYIEETIKSLIFEKPLIKKIEFKNSDYKKLKPVNMLIYCDPPYNDTTQKYNNLGTQFDSKEFWKIMENWSKNNIVFISEVKRKAPKNFKCIWKKSYNSKINVQNSLRIERLFIHKKWITEK